MGLKIENDRLYLPMTIRKTTYADVERAAEIYDSARRFMREAGNPTQWASGYPNADTVREDIESGASYVLVDGERIIAVFYFSVGEDEAYKKIYGGAWLSDEPYAVIHRIAVSDEARGKGAARFIFSECLDRYPNIKIDTHRDNIPMQRALTSSGFEYCGIIYLASGEERLAYQRTKK